MNKRRFDLLYSYGLAVLAVGVAAGACKLFQPWLHPAPTPFFTAAVVVTAIYAGLRPALLAAVLGLGVRYWIFFAADLRMHPADIAVTSLIFLLVAFVISRLVAKLQEQREWLRITLNSIGDAVITTDTDGRVTFLNPVAVSLTGWPPEEALGQPMTSVFQIINEQTRKPAEDLVARVLSEKRVVALANHTALIAKDGRELPIEDSAAPILNAAGQPTGVVLVFHDVTQKRRAQEALRESEERLRLAVWAADLGAFEWTFPEDRTVWENPRMYEIFGQRREDGPLTRAQLLARAIHPDDAAAFEAALAEGMKPGHLFNALCRIRRRNDGELRWVEFSGRFERAPDGAPLRLMGVVGDVTERQMREEELHKLNRTLKALSNSNQAMMRAEDEADYLDEVCRIIVKDCGHAMVWIGFADEDEAKSVRPVAHAGFEEGYLETLQVSWADTERGRGPTGTAIRTGKPSLCANMQTDPRFGPWRKEAIKRGYASSLVLPLLAEGKAFGAVSIYSRQPEAFSPDEVQLLTELADDLAYGIAAIRLRVAHAEAEEAIRQSEARERARAAELAAVLEAVPATIWIAHDPDSRRITGNRAADELLRLPSGANASLTAGTAERPTHFKIVKDGRELAGEELPVQRAARGTALKDFEFGLVFGDGTMRHLLGNATPLHDEQGRVRGSVAAFVDITGRKEAEQQVQRQNAVLTAINRIFRQGLTCETEEELGRTCLTVAEELSGSKFGFLAELNAQGRLNDVAISDPGWEACRMEHPAGQRKLPHDLEVHGIYGRVVLDGKGFFTNDPASHPDRIGTPPGHPALTAFLGVPLIRAGKTIGMVGLGNRDGGYRAEDLEMVESLAAAIMEALARKRAEAQREENLQRLETLMETVPALVWIAEDPDCGRMRGNRAVYEALGLPLGANVSQTAPEPERPATFEAFRDGHPIPSDQLPMQKAARTGQPVLGAELELRFAGGLSRWIYGNAVPLWNPGGSVQGALGAFIDITDIVRAREVLARSREELERLVAERTAKLREMVGELEHFSYSITHDMRAPLRAMAGYAKLLREEYGRQVEPDGQEYLRRIAVAAERMDKLIGDALSYSQVVRAEFTLEPVNVVALLRGMIDSYPNLHPPQAEIRLEGDFPLVLGNEAALTQCFSNLLGNAVKFVAPGTAPRVRVWAEPKDDGVRLWFEDNGIGIPKDSQQRIFDMFQRLDKQYEGTGIGLALVRKNAERMGGKVGVESEPGRGSRFWLELKKS